MEARSSYCCVQTRKHFGLYLVWVLTAHTHVHFVKYIKISLMFQGTNELYILQTIKIGTYMWKQYTTLCEDIDFVTACNVADGTIANSFSTTTDFGAMVNRIGKGEQITKKSRARQSV